MIKFLKKLYDRPELNLVSAGLSDAGLVRKNNEDCFAILKERNLFIVADGMGGHKAGEVASRTTIEIIRHFFSRKLVKTMQGNPEESRYAMIASFEKANQTVMDLAAEDTDLQGMGCTLVLAYIDGRTLHTCNAGDARGYVVSKGRIKQITVDHTTLMEVRSDPKGKESNNNLPSRHVVTKVIGYPFPAPPEYKTASLGKGDRILLCSDGLWSMLDDQIIQEIICKAFSPQEAAKQLIDAANEAGGHDNITALTIFC